MCDFADSETGVKLFAVVEPPTGPVCLCFCQRNISSVVAQKPTQRAPSQSDLGETFGAGVLGMQMQSSVSKSRFYSVWCVSQLRICAGRNQQQGKSIATKNPTTKGTGCLSSEFNMEEKSWRLGWKDKNLISRGRKCRKTNKNDGKGKMDFWKEDLIWCSSGNEWQ